MRVRISRDPVTTVQGIPERKGEVPTKKAASYAFDDDIVWMPIPAHPMGGPQLIKLSQSDLYPARHAFSPEHITALRLLRLALGRTQRASRALDDGDDVTADSEMQKVQVLLPELFCCRALGDGFGSVLNALMSAFECLRGNMPSILQLRTISRTFELLRDKPFLSADEADLQLEQLEGAHLNTYPPELVDFLSSGESIR